MSQIWDDTKFQELKMGLDSPYLYLAEEEFFEITFLVSEENV